MLRPLNDRVLVKRVPAPEVSRGGIIIPESAKEKTNFGVVVATGPGKKIQAPLGRQEMEVSPGDKIIFGKYSGCDVFQGEEYIVLREDEIQAVLE